MSLLEHGGSSPQCHLAHLEVLEQYVSPPEETRCPQHPNLGNIGSNVQSSMP